MADLAGALGKPLSVCLSPQPHWQAGDALTPAVAAASLLITRSITKDEALQTFVPARFLRGLMPEALLETYTFWQRPDGDMVGQRRAEPAGGGGGGGGGRAANGGASSGGSGVASGGGRGADELTLTISKGGAVIRRVLLDEAGKRQPEGARRLLSYVNARAGVSHLLKQERPRACPSHIPATSRVYLGNDLALISGIPRVCMQLSLIEDLAHTLVWGTPENVTRGGAGDVDVDLVELPRLRLSFEAHRAKEVCTDHHLMANRSPYDDRPSRSQGVAVRMYCREHPGLFIDSTSCERMRALLKGLQV